MVSDRKLHSRKATCNQQTLIELNCKSPPISSISSIASFREKKFKKKSTPYSGHGGDRAFGIAARKKGTLRSHGIGRKDKADDKRLSRGKPDAVYAKKGRIGRSDPPHMLLSTASKQFNHHSPRAFSLLTLQEYLQERSHLVGTPPAAYNMNNAKDCEMYMESSHILHMPLFNKSRDDMPLLPSELQRSYSRKPRRNAAEYCTNGAVLQCKCNKGSCKHKLKGDCQSVALSNGEEISDDDDDDDKNEAISVEGHHHGCVPWHSFSSMTPKYNKKQIIMELAGRSFSCGGLPVSKRYNRGCASVKSCIAPTTQSPTTRGWDSVSSNSGSEGAPLLSDWESEAYNNSSRIRCYPACNSLPCIMRQKSHDANMDSNMQSKHSSHGNQSGHVKTNGHGGIQCRKSQMSSTTMRKKGSGCRVNNTETDTGRHNSQSMKSRGKISKRFLAAKSREKHQSLSEKYRPRTFEDMVGQAMITQALSNAVLKRKIAMVYLFQGPRGTGKKSVAKIFAASINCLSKDPDVDTTAWPCGVCRHCESIYFGKSSKLIREVDASGNNGIEDMRSLLRFISMGSQHSNIHKVLIIDECHVLTKEAWNLFLSILEEPPSPVVFILITTDTEQIPRMVLSKCQKFPFTKIKDADVLSRLQRICSIENIDIESDALQLIASRSDGSLYDAETTLDQLTNLGQRITSSVVREMVGLVAEEKLMELLEGALRGESVTTVRSVRELMQTGVEPLALMSQLATLITDLLAGNFNLISSSPFSQPLGKVELEKLRQALRILSEAEKQLRSCDNKTTWLTAALLQFSPPPDLSFNHPFQSSSLAGTSLTQSPIALLDTSEKETADTLCNVGAAAAANNPTIKPPWDRNQHWQSDDDDDDGSVQDRRTQDQWHASYMSSTEKKAETHKTNQRTSLHRKASQTNAVDDAFGDSRYGAYQRNDIRVACENFSHEPSRVDTGGPCLDYSTHNKSSSQATPSSMDDIWRKVLEGSVLREILSGQGKLLSLSVSEAYAIAHLEFRSAEDKRRAEKAKSSMAKAFQMALGCPVEVKLSLASSKSGDLKGDKKTSKRDARTCASEKGHLNQKHRRRKTKTRSKRGGCNEGYMYYSKWQPSYNPSISHKCSGNYSLTNDPYSNTRASSSDENFTNWTHVSKSGMGASCYKTQADRRMNKLNYERDVGFVSSSSHMNRYVVEERANEVVHHNSQDSLYDASLRVERPDSFRFASQSFNEYAQEYDCNTMTPAFRTGFLCWRGTAMINTHDAKVAHHRARRRRKMVLPLLGCVPCAHDS